MTFAQGFKSTSTIALAACLAGYAFPAVAQDTETTEEDMRQIIVTSQQQRKQVESEGSIGVLGDLDALSTPFNVSSYTAQLILDQQSETLGDVLENEPSVRTTYGAGNQSELFVVRGFTLNGDDVAIDGLYGITPRQLISPELYDSVQVLNGAAAFLFGAAPGGSGIGGTINLIPKVAGADLFRVTGSYNGELTFGGNFDCGKRFGADDQFGVRVMGVYRDGDTAVDNEQRKVGVAGITFDYDGGPARIKAHLGYEDQRASWSRPTIVLEPGVDVPSVPDGEINYGQPWTFTKLQDLYGIFKGEFDVTKNLIAYMAFGFRDGSEDGDYSQLRLQDDDGTAQGGRLFVPRVDNNYAGQVGVRAKFNTGPVSHNFNAGISVGWTTNKNSFLFGSFPAEVRTCATSSFRYCTNIYDPVIVAPPTDVLFASAGSLDPLPRVGTTELESYYVSDTLGFVDDRVLVTLGAREQNMKIKTYSRSTGEVTAEYDERALTPVVGIVVKPTENISLYANRIEGLVQGPTAPASVVNFGEVFPPERSEQYEIGGKIQFEGVTGTVALFTIDRPFGFTDPVDNIFKVDGRQRNRGIEVSVNGEPSRYIRLIGGFTILDTDVSGGVNDGLEVAGVPNFQANIGAEVIPPFFDALTITSRLVHTGSQWANTSNTAELDSWTRFDLGARYVAVLGDHPVTFRVFAENVFDNDYWYSAYNGYLLQGQPRTLRASVTFEY